MEQCKGWHFPLEVDALTGKIKTTTLENDIKQSILILLHTQKGERLGHSDYGSQLRRFLFEPLQSSLKRSIQKEVENTIKKWEKRVSSVTVDIFESLQQQTVLIVQIQYDITQTQQSYTLQYAFDLTDVPR